MSHPLDREAQEKPISKSPLGRYEASPTTHTIMRMRLDNHFDHSQPTCREEGVPRTTPSRSPDGGDGAPADLAGGWPVGLSIALSRIHATCSHPFSSTHRHQANMSTERTYVMIKPDGVHRGLVGEIIARFERKGFKLVALKVWKVTRTRTHPLSLLFSFAPLAQSLSLFASFHKLSPSTLLRNC